MKSSTAALAAALLTTAACMLGCKHPISAAYDPQYDGITPVSAAAPDLTILENQKALYDKLAAANAGAPHPTPASPAPAAPTTPAAPASPTPPPPQG